MLRLSLRRRPLSTVLAALFAALSAAPSPAGPPTASEPDALAGHAAEATMRDSDAERRHRRLFFDPAPREEGTAGVACDHRARRAPHAVAGLGRVEVAHDGGRLLARVWTPPGGDGLPGVDAAATRRRLAALAAEAGGDPATLVAESRTFAWCR